jgi:two-component system response regulator NreC
MDKISVLLAEDHTMMRQGLRSLLEAEPDIEVIGEAEDGREALQKVQALQPDVVVMDITMPGLNGVEATRQIKKRLPHIKVLVLTMHTAKTYVFQLLRAGVSGYLVKQAAVSELVLAIRTVYQGDSFLSSAISQTVIEEFVRQTGANAEPEPYDTLTDREREVLQLVAEGHSSREIAALLFISPKTVRVHRSNLLEKLGFHSTAELTQYAVQKGIISLDE